TILPCLSVILPPQALVLLAIAPYVAPSSEPDATLLPSESGRQLHQYRKKDLRNLRIVQALVRSIGVSPRHCGCPFRRVRKVQDERPLPLQDNSLRRP